MHLFPEYDRNHSGKSESDYLNELYGVFLRELVNSGLRWKPSGVMLSLRREPEVDGRHASFWHIVSGGSSVETERILDLERCARIKWVRPLIERFNKDFPAEIDVLWWKSADPRWRGRRYGIATQSFDYIIFIDERHNYALLVSAYYVERERRRLKFKQEHDAFWAKKQEPLA